MPDEGSNTANSKSHRISALAVLPVFFKLDGKRVVLAGGGEPSLWKAELLSAAGARVEVFSESFADGFRELVSSPPGGRVDLKVRRWTPEDLNSAAMAVGAFGDDGEAEQFASAARAAGVPVNVVDRPAFCDFQFGAIVNRSPLVVGVSTDGAAPVFGQAIRSLIESLLPESFKLWAEAARSLRGEGDRLGDTMEKKRRFWQRFTDLALRSADRGPASAELAGLMGETSDEAARHPVAIIEIGPHGAEALTLGAIRVLRGADDIFFDEDVPASVMEFARREARRHPISAGQAVTNEMVSAAARGGRLVRIRMSVWSGANEGPDEAAVLRAAGVPVVVVAPGHVP
ncbi:NAD(P)-dependent oxidoreductase [Hyphomicrobium sp.]|uniref:siroheme synthase n=1 Tax=Hyphomicrobium sp. TaxID=82 RepID=UPI000FBBB880|nr:NAD(P)-dependent oxidoreductase [Hyphomicrobium sp.]RUP09152.1 MAG: siroheme synthase [Hyphomicrobium sp.]